MTDFQQELSEPAAIEQGFWESTRYPSYLQSAPSGGTQRQPAAALIAAVTELADVIARKRAPRMDGLRVRLQRSDGSRELGDLEVALRGLHRASAELDVLAAREGELVDSRGAGSGASSRNSRKNGSTPKFVRALPKNTGDSSPARTAASSNGCPASSSRLMSCTSRACDSSPRNARSDSSSSEPV